ncbi:cupin domain-containing protein [Micromonospora sp. NPDC047548]|uniref:JmjC domain-containing protein n=1 Tax=Micromonospora sp. NPDC047548 TaxID=3155624 RepID=UPI0034006F66
MFDEALRGWGMPHDFMEKHWRCSPAAGRQNPDAPGVPAPVQVRELLSCGLRADRVTVSTTGRLHHPAEFTVERVISGRTVPDVVDPDRLSGLVEQGATVILADGEHWMPWSIALAALLAEESGCEIQAHVFITGGKQAGLVPHVDGEDNFLLQIDGSKSWSLWPNQGGVSARHVDPDQLGPPAMTVDLHPGDSLYIPVGWVHAAVAGDEGSMHITYQVVPVRLSDALLDQLAEELEPLLGEDLAPIGASPPLAANIAEELVASIVGCLQHR